MPEPKIFRHQSGLMQAVKTDLDEVLEATVVMVEKVRSDPPPKESLHPVDPGLYSVNHLDNIGHPGLVETVTTSKHKWKR
jgi:hypothetical protein